MDTLVIGIDGGDKDVLSAMDLDFLSRFFDRHGTLEVKEDLWNRGWGSIISGEHGRTTGGFYEKPKLDGTHDFEQSFGTHDYERNEDITPLWESLNENGRSVGFMNVRTTMPAPQVDGFFVSGAGGGFKPSGGVPEVACHPDSIYDILSESDYIWETRFIDSGVRDAFDYLELVSETVSQRADAFLKLCEKFDPDFGFVAQTETVGIQNLAMVEIQPMIEDQTDETSKLQNAIQNFYQLVDRTIDTMVNELSPENIIIVSDHGAAPYKHSINADAFLKRLGMQPTVGGAEQQSRALIRRVGQIAPPRLVNFVSSLSPTLRDKATRPDTNWAETKAFGHRYVPGIYINDDRFAGPIHSNEYDEVLEEVIEKFNHSSEAKKFNLKASRYRAKYSDSKKSALLPDVWIEKPDTMFFEGVGEFVESNGNYRSILQQNLHNAERNMLTGKKGSQPILSFNFDSTAVNSDPPYNLTLAYDVILEASLT